MKKFLFKTRKNSTIGGLLVLIIIVGAFYLWKLHRNDGSIINVLVSRTPTLSPTPTSIDPKIKDFGLKIDKLNILVPVIKNVNGSDKAIYNTALKNGVAHFKDTALPGEKGNIFIFGHSSAEIKADYSKIFAKLNDLEKGDEIIIFYQGKDYKYKVKNKDIVEATDISVLDKGKKEILTLMTCWPIGTKDKRLIIRAEPVEK
ncbi:MAG: class D sortase [Candidatus Berkelbacteria bacterium]|nr:class D sortase [Candidatus Berkelbacteria bacterium]